MLPTKRQLTKVVAEAVEGGKILADRAKDYQLVTFAGTAYLYWPSKSDRAGTCAAVRDTFSKGRVHFYLSFPDDVEKGSFLEARFIPWVPTR